MFEHWIKTDLQKLPEVKTLQGRYFSEDDEANKVGVYLKLTNGTQVTTLGALETYVYKAM